MKKILVILLIIGLVFILSGCSQPKTTAIDGGSQVVSDTKAYIRFDSQSMVIEVREWLLGSGGTVRLTALDGTQYITHSSNVLVIKEKGD